MWLIDTGEEPSVDVRVCLSCFGIQHLLVKKKEVAADRDICKSDTLTNQECLCQKSIIQQFKTFLYVCCSFLMLLWKNESNDSKVLCANQCHFKRPCYRFTSRDEGLTVLYQAKNNRFKFQRGGKISLGKNFINRHTM